MGNFWDFYVKICPFLPLFHTFFENIKIVVSLCSQGLQRFLNL
nr:MAG TPA: hypothetical protein [Caudoviricetes sp.]